MNKKWRKKKIKKTKVNVPQGKLKKVCVVVTLQIY